MPKLRAKAYPSDILKGCLILGIQPEELTENKVRSAWKLQLSAMARIRDEESAKYLMDIKGRMIDWIREQRSPNHILQHKSCLHVAFPPPNKINSTQRIPRTPLPSRDSCGTALPEPLSKFENHRSSQFFCSHSNCHSNFGRFQRNSPLIVVKSNATPARFFTTRNTFE